jgi:hypothetical protein
MDLHQGQKSRQATDYLHQTRGPQLMDPIPFRKQERRVGKTSIPDL